MTVSHEEILFEPIGNTDTDGNSDPNLNSSFIPNCRFNNHQLSAQRIEIIGGHHNDNNNECFADQYLFIVICRECNLEWTELWRTSRWFIRNNGNSKPNPDAIMVNQRN